MQLSSHLIVLKFSSAILSLSQKVKASFFNLHFNILVTYQLSQLEFNQLY